MHRKEPEIPSFEDLPPEVQDLIFRQIPEIKDLVKLREVSKTSKALVDNIIGKPEKVFDIISRLPPAIVRKFIQYYRNTVAFQELTKKYQENPDRISAHEMICYALTTNDIETIRLPEFKNALAAIARPNILGKPETLFNFISYLPHTLVMEFIQYYRSTDAFWELTTKYQANPGQANTYEILCYALATHDINTIRLPELKNALATIPEQQISNLWYGLQLTAYVLATRPDELVFINRKNAFVNLAGANLRDAKLLNANLNWANLEGADLSDAHLNFAQLNHANLQGANLIDANLNNAQLKNANLNTANLSFADMQEANLEGADLRKANVSHAFLYNANLTNTKLEGCFITDATLDPANLFNLLDTIATSDKNLHAKQAAFSAFVKQMIFRMDNKPENIDTLYKLFSELPNKYQFIRKKGGIFRHEHKYKDTKTYSFIVEMIRSKTRLIINENQLTPEQALRTDEIQEKNVPSQLKK